MVQSTTQPRRRESHPRRWLILGALCLSMLVVGLDGTVLNVALSDIAVAIGATTSDLQWIVNAYLLALAVLLIPAGVLGDRVGRGRVLSAGLAVFVAASALAAWTTTPGGLVAARAAMGLGAAAIMPVSISVIPTIFAPDERRKAVAIVTTTMAVGMPLGPLVGGWLLEHYWWGSTMLINVPIVGVALTACVLLVPNTRDTERVRLDLGGLVLSALGFTALVYAVVSAPQEGWGSGKVLGSLGAAVVLLAGLLVVERKVADPLLSRDIVALPMFIWPTAVIAIGSLMILGLLFVLPQFIQVVQGNTAFGTGLRLMPMMLALAIGAGAADRILKRGSLRVVVSLGMVLIAGGFAALATLDARASYTIVAVALVGIGMGSGMAIAPATDAMLASLPSGRESTGTSLNNAAKQLGSAFGVALLGNLLSAAYQDRIAPALHGLAPAAQAVAHGSIQGAEVVAGRLGGDAGLTLAASAEAAFLDGVRAVSLACIGISLATAAVSALWFPRTSERAAPQRDSVLVS